MIEICSFSLNAAGELIVTLSSGLSRKATEMDTSAIINGCPRIALELAWRGAAAAAEM